MISVLVMEHPGHDGVLMLGKGSNDGVPLFGGEEVPHGLSYPSSSDGKPSIEVLPPEIPGGSVFGSEDLSVSD